MSNIMNLLINFLNNINKQSPKHYRDPQELSVSKSQNQLQTNNSSSKVTQFKMAKYCSNSVVFTLLFVLILIVSMECHYFKRTQYHEQGLHGPKSYKFGYTAGDHKNPQERHEVSDGYGHVKGWYSFVDAYGKPQVVHYEAHPKYGFKIYNHKSKAINNGKRHYNS